MKIAVVLFSLFLAVALVAQAANQYAMITPSGAVAGCPAPLSGSNILCSVTDGYYVSVSGGAYTKIGAVASGVTSFNGRTGNVMPAASDYSLGQLSGSLTPAQMPTTMTCTLTAVVGTSDTATLSGCR